MSDKPVWEKDFKEMTDAELWDQVRDRAAWLFYGDLDEHFQTFLVKVFSRSFSDWGFGAVTSESPDFQVAYWLLVSELSRLGLYDYGTSPRGGWWSPEGERWKALFLAKATAGEIDWHQEESDS